MHQIKYWLFACLILLSIPHTTMAETDGQNDEKPVSIEEKVTDLVHMDGFFDLYWDQQKGLLLLEIDRMDDEFIYQSSMPRGVGSNDLGLDRGQLGSTKLVEFYRSGPKVLMIEKNTGYRAISSDPAENAAVESSFARSVIWGFELVAETDHSVLVDATAFFLSDTHNIPTRLSRTQQGSYKPEPTRSAIFLPRTKAFPDNTEVEAIISYTGEQKFNDKGKAASDILSTVVPDTNSVTVHLHHSFIRLPDDNYEPLPYDTRASIIGSPWGNGFLDYAGSQGWTVVPAIQMAANPSGMVTQNAIDTFHEHFFKVFERECSNVDGIFLVLHGAMVSEECDDVEGAFLREIRKRLDAHGIDIPVAAVIDLHANVSLDMTDFSTCLYSYRMNPHNDAREAAVQATALLGQLMRGRKATQHHLATRYLIPPTGLATVANPMKAVQAKARAIEAEDSDILCINVMGGFSYADIADCGFSINCSTSGNPATARGYLSTLVDVFEANMVNAYPTDSALNVVLDRIDNEPRGKGPVLLVEPADNIGGGTPGDGTGLLTPLLQTGRKNIVAILNDAEAASICSRAKIRHRPRDRRANGVRSHGR